MSFVCIHCISLMFCQLVLSLLDHRLELVDHAVRRRLELLSGLLSLLLHVLNLGLHIWQFRVISDALDQKLLNISLLVLQSNSNVVHSLL